MCARARARVLAVQQRLQPPLPLVCPQCAQMNRRWVSAVGSSNACPVCACARMILIGFSCFCERTVEPKNVKKEKHLAVDKQPKY